MQGNLLGGRERRRDLECFPHKILRRINSDMKLYSFTDKV